MNRLKRSLLAVALAGAVALTPAASAGQGPVTAYAHGHHGGGHHITASTSYYYCGGHAAHTHSGGVCPYADNYYYCGGHAAHTHSGGVCPYAYSSVSKTTIKKVQKALKRCGYSCGTADGVMGNKTVKALKKFQRANGLAADGVIGSATLRALGL